MYVRTKKGEIFECYESEQMHKSIYYAKKSRTNGYIDYEDVYKKSNNIIDILEIGDYVNGDRVKALKGDIESHKINNEEDVIYTEYINDYDEWCGYEEDEIKSIVTKECFESMEYKI